MKKILFTITVLLSVYAKSQVLGADMLNLGTKTTAEMNAITVAQGRQVGSYVDNSDTGSLWRYNGTAWVDQAVSGGGGSDDDITAVSFDGTNLTVTEGATSFSADISGVDTQLNQTEVGAFATAEGFITTYTETDPTVNQALIEGFGFVTGAHTVNTDDQTATEVTNTAVNGNTNVQAVLDDHETRIDALVGGGSDGAITDLTLNGTTLEVTGTGTAENVDVDLSSLQDGFEANTNDFVSAGNVSGTDLTLTIANQTNPVIDLSPFLLETNSALVKLDEGNGFGFVRVGRTANNYGNVGENAIDFSTSTSFSTTNGATGNESFANGENVIASGDSSFSNGVSSTASGTGSFANGLNANATANYALALGFDVTASGVYSFARGDNVTSAGQNSFASGTYVNSPSYAESTLGYNATTYTPGSATTIVSTDRLFTLGNGASPGSTSDALIVLKDGTITAPSLSTAEITTAGNSALITKEYADANYSGGGSTLTQEEVEDYVGGMVVATNDGLNYTDASGALTVDNSELDASVIPNVPSGNLTSPTIQGALNELQSEVDAFSVSSNSDVLTFSDEADGYTFLATDFDSGRKMFENFSATDEEYVLDDVASVGEKVVISQKGTGKIQVAEGTASLPLGEFQTKDNQTHLTLYKASDNNYYVIGDWDTYTSTPAGNPNLFDGGATNPGGLEANGVGNWQSDEVANTTIVASTAQVNEGTYSLAVTQNSEGANNGDSQASITLVGVAEGTYDFSMDYYVPVGVDDFRITVDNPGTGLTYMGNTISDGTGAWLTKTGTVTIPPGGQDVRVFYRVSNVYPTANTLPATIYADNLTLILQ